MGARLLVWGGGGQLSLGLPQLSRQLLAGTHQMCVSSPQVKVVRVCSFSARSLVSTMSGVGFCRQGGCNLLRAWGPHRGRGRQPAGSAVKAAAAVATWRSHCGHSPSQSRTGSA